jgi:MFS family permease
LDKLRKSKEEWSNKKEAVNLFVRHWLEEGRTANIENCNINVSIYTGGQIGTIIAMPICGTLASSAIGWPSIFYIFGSLGICWVLLWMFLGADCPGTHRFISKAEQVYIETNLGCKVSTNTVRGSSHFYNTHKASIQLQNFRITLLFSIQNTNDFVV